MAEVQKDIWMSSGPTPLHKPLQAGGGGWGGTRILCGFGLGWVGLVGWLAVVGFFVFLLLFMFFFFCCQLSSYSAVGFLKKKKGTENRSVLIT